MGRVRNRLATARPPHRELRHALSSRRVTAKFGLRKRSVGRSVGLPSGRPITRCNRRDGEAYPDVRVVLPAHANPAVRAQVERGLAGVARVTITDPLPYPALARLLSHAYLALTDSGGIQEEAPTFGVPALVLREVTERVESLRAGCAKLVGTDEDLIVSEAARLLDDPVLRRSMTAGGNPYGDGLASRRTEQAVAALLGLAQIPAPMPTSASLV
ncbi:UDP-N-acetylglucosamine 2-epimerase [Dactylosporangium sp. NPDC048998]|uniref:UDP-N-acetylglucosamine 2-epimerase n=1 Tax=Dactylosporangium sp. NPDC048998 TaxID=3363976 RepID=UPI00371309E6